MSNNINALIQNWEYVLLMFIRVSALIFNSPIFGRRSIPQSAKIGLCLGITYSFFIALPPVGFVLPWGMPSLIIMCLMELLFGLIVSYALNVFFAVALTSGQLIDMQMGFGMANVYDSQSNISVPVSGNFLNIILLMLFFVADGHLRLIEMLFIATKRIPIGHVVFSPYLASVAIDLFIKCFLLAIYVALPVIALSLLGEFSLGVLVRAIPQLNAFAIGLPMKVLMGFLVLYAIMPIYAQFAGGLFDELFSGLDRMFAALAGN